MDAVTGTILPSPEMLGGVAMDDLISRQAAIDFVKSIPYIKKHPNMGELIKEWIEQIPGVQPVQKTGRWIDDNCSECGQYVYHGDANNYCPNCGAKMESENKKHERGEIKHEY